MAEDKGIRIEDRSTLLREGFIRIEKLSIAQTLPDGGVAHLTRYVHDHGHGVAILLYDAARDVVVLVRQFRIGALVGGAADPFLLEAPAGLLDGDAPDVAVTREAVEETGYFVGEAKHLFDMYATPGSVTERVSLYFAFVSATDRVSNGGGLEEEHEHIEVVELPLAEAYGMIATGAIADAKTIILLQWAWLNRAALENCEVPA